MADFDIAIIGGGPAGYAAAICAGRTGKRTVLIEKDRLGGTCLNRGCIPTKYLIANVAALIKAKENAFIENNAGLKIKYAPLIESKDNLVAKIAANVEALVSGAGTEIIRGSANILKDGTVEISGGSGKSRINARNIIIATGSRTSELPACRIDEETILSSAGLLSLRELPESVGIIGGGAIGCEFAYILNGLGVKVTVIEMLEHLLPSEDNIAARTLEASFKRGGIEIFTATKLESVKKSGRGVICALSGGVEKMFDKLLVAVGRVGNAAGVCSEAGKNGFIQADVYYRTSIANIYAVGDVNGISMFAHAAAAQGIAAVENIDGGKRTVYTNMIPRCVYTRPEVASVGMSEDDARRNGIEVKTARFPYAALGKAHAINCSEGFFKITIDAGTKKILGFNIIGEEATDLIGEAVALINKDATAIDLSLMVHPHPTLSEGFWEAANLVIGKPVHVKPR